MIPGWSRRVKTFHTMVGFKYKVWLQYNMPKNGTIYEEMISTRKSFKSELIKYKKNKNNEISKSI